MSSLDRSASTGAVSGGRAIQTPEISVESAIASAFDVMPQVMSSVDDPEEQASCR